MTRESTPPAGAHRAGHGSAGDRRLEPAARDDRAVRVRLAPVSRLDGDPTVVVAPVAGLRLAALHPTTGGGVLGGVVHDPVPVASVAAAGADPVPDARDAADRAEAGRAVASLEDLDVGGQAIRARLEHRGAVEARLVIDRDGLLDAFAVRLGSRRRGDDGVTTQEIVVDGWRFEIETEPERRAALRERARRGGDRASASGPTEVRAIIPGRIAAVEIAAGDAVEAGQQVLVVEAMKMQNELRTAREGTIRSVAVAVGQTIEVGDLLFIIE